MTTLRPLASFSRLVLRAQPYSVRSQSSTVARRALSTTTAARSATSENPHPQKEAQEDREKMSVEPNETSKSTTDSDAAKQDEAAYDPNITDPAAEKKKAGEGEQVNPLDASPANPEISEHTSEASSGGGKKVGGGSNKSSGGSTAGQGNQ